MGRVAVQRGEDESEDGREKKKSFGGRRGEESYQLLKDQILRGVERERWQASGQLS